MRRRGIIKVSRKERPAAAPTVTKAAKLRADQLVVAQGLTETRERAQTLIMAGKVYAGTERVNKSGDKLATDAVLSLKGVLPYVGRGGYKLAGALDSFGIDPVGRVGLDIGASTGGFTDVLLQRGARAVYAVDVGSSQLDWKLRTDPRVVVMDNTNARYLEALPPLPDHARKPDDPTNGAPPISIVVIDVSFISLTQILPTARRMVAAAGDIVALIKPQFEAGRDHIGKGGIVRDPTVHRAVLGYILNWAQTNGFGVRGLINSPVLGTEGNREFLVHLAPHSLPADLETMIATVMEEETRRDEHGDVQTRRPDGVGDE